MRQGANCSVNSALLLQRRVLGLGSDQDRNVGVGVLPELEEILIGGPGSVGVALYCVSAAELKACQGT